MSSPLTRYEQDIQAKGLRPDRAQRAALEHLQRLYQQLHQEQGALERLLSPLVKREAIRGVYLWGGVGRGKTYLMDIFFEQLALQQKTRVHYHRFMQQIHDTLSELPKSPDPLIVVAKRISAQTRVLCLDEFHVQDIVDAMLLHGLLQALFARGVILVTTSNSAPDDLYRNGLQRDRFLPAIELIKQHTEVVHLDSATDYRMAVINKDGTYRLACDDGWMHDYLLRLAPASVNWEQPLSINHRAIKTRALADDVVWFAFDELCRTARSTSDYLEFASTFHTVLLSDVPVLDESLEDAAQRFVHLVDAFYDHQVKLIITAQAPPAQLYRGRQLVHSFERTVSRLTEMGSAAYLGRAHRV